MPSLAKIRHALFQIEAAHRSGEHFFVDPLGFKQPEKFVDVSELLQLLEILEHLARFALALCRHREPYYQVGRGILDSALELPEIVRADVCPVIETRLRPVVRPSKILTKAVLIM